MLRTYIKWAVIVHHFAFSLGAIKKSLTFTTTLYYCSVIHLILFDVFPLILTVIRPVSIKFCKSSIFIIRPRNLNFSSDSKYTSLSRS